MTPAQLLDPPALPAGRSDLGAHLRSVTAASHEHLERSLDLLGRVSDRQRFLAVLEGFHGFHRVWEDAIRQRADLRAFHAPRRRLNHLRRDLTALGRTEAEIDALPACEAAAALVDSHAAAVGSIYVLEGSTLGGQLIDRALAEASWPPAGGLAYFNPYGPRTGAMWREFRAWSDAAVPDEAGRAAASAAAVRTFSLLQTWLPA